MGDGGTYPITGSASYRRIWEIGVCMGLYLYYSNLRIADEHRNVCRFELGLESPRYSIHTHTFDLPRYQTPRKQKIGLILVNPIF